MGPAPKRVALFPGAWNPPTVAHVAIARAALGHADEVVWLLPRAFPHKRFEGASFELRVEMLCRIAAEEGGFSVAVADGGLYFEMAEEAREHFGPAVELALVCGRDAAERIAAWDYGRPGVFNEMLDRCPLLVAGRAGDFLPHARHANRIRRLAVNLDEVSSTEIRRRISGSGDWRGLVPECIGDVVSGIFQYKAPSRVAL
jgi:nicotinic acid mononucleotide adenylyltransferase